MIHESHEILIEIPDVDFELSKDTRNIGRFFLLKVNGKFVFEWRPDPSRDPNELSQNNIPSLVPITVEQTSEIMRRDLSFSEVSLRFILTDSSRLPRFLFCKHSHLHVQHLIEYLLNKKVLTFRPSRPNSYKIAHQSSKTEADIFGYTPPSSLPASAAVNVAEHNSILRKLNFQPLLSDIPPVSVQEIKTTDFSEIKKQIFNRGISPEARPYIWPFLFGALPYSSNPEEINNLLSKRLNEYIQIKKRTELHTKFQVSYSTALQDIQRVIYFDVMRNDRYLDAFKGDDNPNLDLLQKVLTVYAIFNRDAGYCQGMADLMSPLILIFIKKWEKGNVVFYDNSVKTPNEAESFIFWNFVGMMNLTQHDRLFTRLDQQQQFLLERAAMIATSVHQPLKDLLDKHELNGLSFLFRPILLLFKREFRTDDVFRLWDSIFTAEYPYCFPRFISASLLIMIYPKFLLHTDGTLGEVMTVLDGTMERTEVTSVLQVATNLIKKVAEPYPKHDFIYEPLPDIQKLRNYNPKYLKLL